LLDRRGTGGSDRIGHEDATPGGVVASPLCTGTKRSVIRSAGFLDLRGQVLPGGSANITCRIQHP
jgi:hypothetical protein